MDGKNKIRRNKMKKIGLLLMTLVLTLGTLGVGYAAWTDEIYIQGTVMTGDVDINVVELSGTQAWKDLDTEDLVMVHTRQNLGIAEGPLTWNIINVPPPPSNGLLVSEATATLVEEDRVEFNFTNLFPCQDFYVDMVLRYEGSVPGKINFAFIGSQDAWLQDLWDIGWTGDIETSGIWFTAKDAQGEPVDLGYQMHDGDLVYLELHVHIPQDNALMNMSGSFIGGFQVIQWNEFPDGDVIDRLLVVD
jgi:hypothetical protein